MPRRKKKLPGVELIECDKREEIKTNEDEAEFLLTGTATHTCLLKSSPQVGRYLVCKKRLRAGDIILEDEPLVVGPCQDTATVCIGCCSLLDVDIKSSHRCGGCGWPICGGGCPGLTTERRSSRGGHSTSECLVLKSSGDLTASCFNMITPLRCLLLRRDEPQQWSHLIKMESHDDIRRNISTIWTKNQLTVVEPLSKLTQDFPEELIHTICGILEVNCFSVGGEGVDARALYPTAYLLQHDCVPNTTHMDSAGFSMTVRATVDIQKGVPITLSYTSTLYDTLRRRRELKESKFFDCCCARCSSGNELGTYMCGVKCTHCDKGWLVPEQPLVKNAQWKCSSCQQTVHYSIPVNLSERSSADFESLKNAKIPDYEKLLTKYGKVLHPSHSSLVRIKYSLSQMYGKSEGSLLSGMNKEMLQMKYNMCRELLKVFDVIEPGMSRIRGVTLYECHAPLLMLTQIAVASKCLSTKEVKRDLRKVREMLLQAASILSMERPDSTEGKLYLAAKEALIQADSWPI